MYLLTIYIGIALGAAIYLVGRLSGWIPDEAVGAKGSVPPKRSLPDSVASCLLYLLAFIYLGRCSEEILSVDHVSLWVFLPQLVILLLALFASWAGLRLIFSFAHHARARSN